MSQPPFEDDRAHNDESLTWADSFVIPHDISSLEDDIARWRYEQTLNRRRTRFAWAKRLIPGWIHHIGITAPLLVGTFLVVGLLGAAMTFLTPSSARPTPAEMQPLATTSVQPGSVGGLLPLAAVATEDGTAIDLRSLRPAILTLVPAGCTCGVTITHLSAAATPYGVRQYVVTTDSAELAALKHVGVVPNGLLDGGVLRMIYGGVPDKPTIVVVGADGSVRAIEVGVNASTALNGYLDELVAVSSPSGQN